MSAITETDFPPAPPAGRESASGWLAASAVIGALGTALICLDGEFHVLNAAPELDDLLGEGSARRAVGRPAEDSLGADLFGANAALRHDLTAGRRCVEWPVSLPSRAGSAPFWVVVTAAPIGPEGVWDRRLSYVVALRPLREEERVADPAQEDLARRLRAALERNRWRRSAAARALGISRTTLWRMMRDAGLSS